MNLQKPNSNDVTQTNNRAKTVVPSSGLCTRCIDGCTGNCEIFQAAFRGRELLYPGPYGTITAGGDKDYPVDYSHLNIQGYAVGAKGLPEDVEGGPDTTLFPTVNTETEIGCNHKVMMRMPIFTGALGSTEVARRNWEDLVVGAAIAGVTIVCGENVCGMDPQAKLNRHNRVVESPEMRRRVEQYRRWYEGYGDLFVQMNVEDTRFGVAEYVIEKLGVETVELKWGQGAKCIGGEVKAETLERALELQRRGYLVTPDPSLPTSQAAFKAGALRQFERHSRLGFIDQEVFMKEVERLRKLGAKRVTLKTGAYSMRELAMAIKWSSDARIDLVTIDGAGGGTGMSPWRMMVEWGIPTFYLEAMTYELCSELAARGAYVPDIAIAGGFSTEDHIFKALAMGAPFVKAVCMGRALMIPGMVGKNVGIWLKEGKLPKTVARHGSTVEEIFVNYEVLREKYGEAVNELPLGAIGFYSFVDKLRVGLQQLMAGSRNFQVSAISRNDLMALTDEAARVSGIPYVMDAYREEAERIIHAGTRHPVLSEFFVREYEEKKTMIVVKAGGGEGLDMEAVCADIAELVAQGEKVILVHGCSHETNVISEKLSHPPRFVTSASGYISRYTDRETLEILTMVTAGRINKLLVERLQQLGVNAIGLSGLDGRLLEGKRKSALRIVESGKRKVLRGEYSGRIERVNVELLQTLVKAGYVPVVAPLAISYEGEGLNVDGDRVAAAIATALNAEKVIILTNVPGLLRDFPDESTLISHIPLAYAQEHLDRYAQGQMKRKLLGAIEALHEGVDQVIIADGRVAQPLHRALSGQGTVIR
jgi:acetylglutamate kinase